MKCLGEIVVIVVQLLGNLSVALPSVLSILQEYEDCTSPEAIVVHDLDKFDMIFQAYEYEKGVLCE